MTPDSEGLDPLRKDLSVRARQVLDACGAARVMLACAESCTGGMIAAALTAVPGSSSVLERGFVTYSNAAKTEMLDVPAVLIETHGAVSEPVAGAMADGALRRSHAQIAVAVTGVAGPGGGTPEKPVGLVHMAVATRKGMVRHHSRRFEGGREHVRLATAIAALELVLKALHSPREDGGAPSG